MISRPRFALSLLTLLLALAFPAAASAVYQVNSTGDGVDKALNGTCETSTPGECTLRAAIEESNNSTGVVDTVTFDFTVFEGKLADTITAASQLPTISDQLNILGGRCETEAGAGIEGPCVGVLRSGGGFLFAVGDDDVKIEGLAITGALIGIDVINESERFVAKNDWIGLNLKGEALGNNTGIFIDPGSDEATIGGLEEAERNVIGGNNLEGLDIEGASSAHVLGNYFGVAPDGKTARANAKDIEVTDSTAGAGFQAENNEIGETIGATARGTMKCDGGCNVISGATSSGIDLDGESGGNEAPASGPTTIYGNYVGLDARGETLVQNSIFGILAGAADNAVVGGTAEGRSNSIAGGGYGVYGENGDDLEVVSNVIGRDKSGAPIMAPSNVGIFNYSLDISDQEAAARIAYNSLEMSGGTGIEQRFTGAEILSNDIRGDANVGILTTGSSLDEGNLIEGNRVLDTGGAGIQIENDSNVVIRNEVENAGAAGILVKYVGIVPLASGTTENRVGGDEESEENTLLLNFGPAVEINDLEPTNNEVARNHGEGNGGPFIDLVSAQGSEPNGPNEGIKPPVIVKATTTKVEGLGAQAGAKIRVFRKASSEEGELESFLAEATADAFGNWSAVYPAAVPAGTLVTATQTSVNGGTSELAAPAAATAESGGGGEGGGGGAGGGSNNGGGNNNGGNNGGNGAAKDKTPPDTKIVKGPPKKTHKRTAKFKFTSTEAGSTFQCKMDRKPFKACASPKKFKKLKPGKHVFQVRAIDRAGNVDKTPAKRKFTVLR
jgi:CSLREA domain-containing protein